MEFLFLFFLGIKGNAQIKAVQRATIAFMNVENLWDTIPSVDYIDGFLDPQKPNFHRSIPIDSVPHKEISEQYRGIWTDTHLKGKKVLRHQILNEDFTPKSAKNWTKKKYHDKLQNLAEVLSRIGKEYTGSSPAIVGFAEIENRQVLQDLLSQPELAKGDYDIIHYNSYDTRGIDVGLIYQKKRFLPLYSLKKEIKLYKKSGKRHYTRDILVVMGLLDGEKTAFLVNHWPSRYGNSSSEMRNTAALTLKKQMDSLRKKIPNIKLFAMGDFNDNPDDPSFSKYLKVTGITAKISEETPYYNPMWKMFKKGLASTAFRDLPALFDQFILSYNLVSRNNPNKYSLYKAGIYAPPYLVTDFGPWKGYPYRSWNGDLYTGGYSDHFPIYCIIERTYDQNLSLHKK
ncbi:MAG: endonuclease [Bergeyella sp.]|nr:endonuclease [Bergeyella sp.]